MLTDEEKSEIEDFKLRKITTVKRTKHLVAKNLILDMMTTGSTFWRFTYMLNNTRHTITLGELRHKPTAELFSDYQLFTEQLAQGINPILSFNQRKQANQMLDLKVSYLCDMYEHNHLSKLKNPHNQLYLMNKHIRPKLGNSTMITCNITTVAAKLTGLTDVMKHNTIALLNAVFNYTIELHDLNFQSPLKNKAKKIGRKASKTTRTLTERELKTTLQELPATSLNSELCNATFILLATAMRKNELLTLLWSDIDLDERVIRIRSEHIKTAGLNGNKGEPHTLYISDFALEYFNRQKMMTGHKKYIFYCNSNYFNKALTNAILQLDSRHFTPHDLRRTFRTQNAERGEDKEVLKRIMNHTQTGVESHYDFSKLEAGKAATLGRWGDYLEAVRDGLPIPPTQQKH